MTGSPGYRAAPVPSIRTGDRDDIAAVAALIADAFHPLAVSRWLVPDPLARAGILRANFTPLIGHAVEHGRIDLVTGQAAAVWLPSDAPPPKPNHTSTLAGAARFRTLDALFAAHQPRRAHHHLLFLAVSPDRQGGGLGTRLLSHGHRLLHGTGRPAYLEAASPRSRDLYQRHGYQRLAPIGLPNGTLMWPMWREPTG